MYCRRLIGSHEQVFNVHIYYPAQDLILDYTQCALST